MRARDAAISIPLDLAESDSTYEMVGRPSGLVVITRQKIIRIRSDDVLDPSGSHPDAPWEQSVYAPHGSEDPVVARTIIQTARMCEVFFGRASPQYDAMWDVAWDVMSALISLRHIRTRLEQEIDVRVAEIEIDLQSYTTGRAPKALPSVPYLDIEFRSYINEVRRLLSKISEVFAILTDHPGENGHFHKALSWVKLKYGEEHVLTAMLAGDLRWIQLWIDVRVAIEHPKRDKYVEVLNFGIEPDRRIRLPTWRFVHPNYPEMHRPQAMIEPLTILESNLLKFFEDLQVVLLPEKKIGPYRAAVAVIEDAERDEVAPMRYEFGHVDAEAAN